MMRAHVVNRLRAMVRLYIQGVPIREIAQKYKLSPGHVSRLLHSSEGKNMVADLHGQINQEVVRRTVAYLTTRSRKASMSDAEILQRMGWKRC
jgi:DNA-binding MarR family transcriptional regulator